MATNPKGWHNGPASGEGVRVRLDDEGRVCIEGDGPPVLMRCPACERVGAVGGTVFRVPTLGKRVLCAYCGEYAEPYPAPASGEAVKVRLPPRQQSVTVRVNVEGVREAMEHMREAMVRVRPDAFGGSVVWGDATEAQLRVDMGMDYALPADGTPVTIPHTPRLSPTALARLGGDRNIGRDLDWDDPDEVGT